MNSKRLGVFLGLGAALLLALTLLVPVAGASTTQPSQGMMGGGSTRRLVWRRHLERQRRLGRHGHVGHRLWHELAHE